MTLSFAIVVVVLWLVAPVAVARAVAPTRVAFLVATVLVVAYAAGMWTAILGSDSSTAGIGFITMWPLAYLPMLALWLWVFALTKA